MRNSPEFILSIVKDNLAYKTGPTGKSWLTDRLREIGCDVVELSEDIYSFVDYKDSENHYLIDPFKKITIIILNQPLKTEG